MNSVGFPMPDFEHRKTVITAVLVYSTTLLTDTYAKWHIDSKWELQGNLAVEVGWLWHICLQQHP